MGFVQVRLEVVAIISSNIAALVRAGPTSLNIGSKYLSLSKAGQRFRADVILMPHLTQSPNVSSNFKMTQYQIQVGQIKVNLPDANQSSFSIFEDLAELFDKEYQSEAVKLFKSKIQDVKPKPSIDSESDFTSIQTSNVDTLLSAINAIIDLCTDVNKKSFAQLDQVELKKIFVNAKKNRPKPKEWNTGDVFAIPLTDKSFSFGQVLDKKYCTCVLFDIRSDNAVLNVSEFKRLKPISILHLSNGDLLNSGQWQILFNENVTLNPSSGSGGKFGTVGASSYGQCGAMTDLADAYWGLTPWNVLYDENYYDKILLKGITRPNAALILNPTDRQKYRQEKFGIAS